MKKFAFVFAAIVAVSFASCGNKAAAPAEAEADTALVDSVADSLAVDSVAADTAVAE